MVIDCNNVLEKTQRYTWRSCLLFFFQLCHWKVDQVEVNLSFLVMIHWINFVRGNVSLGQIQIIWSTDFCLKDVVACEVVKQTTRSLKVPDTQGCPHDFDSQSLTCTARNFIGSFCLSYWHAFDTICSSCIAKLLLFNPGDCSNAILRFIKSS